MDTLVLNEKFEGIPLRIYRKMGFVKNFRFLDQQKGCG